MNTTTLVVFTIVVGIAGTFAKYPGDTKKVIRMLVGFGAYAFGALALEYLDSELASQMALLVFVSALLYYGIPISRALRVFWE